VPGLGLVVFLENYILKKKKKKRINWNAKSTLLSIKNISPGFLQLTIVMIIAGSNDIETQNL
jgi:hypothetical protein